MSTASHRLKCDADAAPRGSGFAAEIARSYPGLMRLLRSRIKDRELANDLVHQAIAITLEHTRAGRVKAAHLAGYVFATAQNLLRNYRRHSSNRAELRGDSELLERMAASEPASGEDPARMRRIVKRMLASLNGRDFDVITRFYLEECEKEQICRDLGLTSLQFNQVISRARQRLRDELERRGFHGADFICALLALA